MLGSDCLLPESSLCFLCLLQLPSFVSGNALSRWPHPQPQQHQQSSRRWKPRASPSSRSPSRSRRSGHPSSARPAAAAAAAEAWMRTGTRTSRSGGTGRSLSPSPTSRPTRGRGLRRALATTAPPKEPRLCIVTSPHVRVRVRVLDLLGVSVCPCVFCSSANNTRSPRIRTRTWALIITLNCQRERLCGCVQAC